MHVWHKIDSPAEHGEYSAPCRPQTAVHYISFGNKPFTSAARYTLVGSHRSKGWAFPSLLSNKIDVFPNSKFFIRIYITTHAVVMDPSRLAQNLESGLRLLLGLSTLAFPLILPFLFPFFFTGQEDEGISNEDLWKRMKEENSGTGYSDFSTLSVHHVYEQILPCHECFAIRQSFISGIYDLALGWFERDAYLPQSVNRSPTSMTRLGDNPGCNPRHFSINGQQSKFQGTAGCGQS